MLKFLGQSSSFLCMTLAGSAFILFAEVPPPPLWARGSLPSCAVERCVALGSCARWSDLMMAAAPQDCWKTDLKGMLGQMLGTLDGAPVNTNHTHTTK